MKQKLANLFKIEIAYMVLLPVCFLCCMALGAINFSLSSLVKFPISNPRMIHIDEITVQSHHGRGGGNAFFKYKGNRYRAGCYVEVAKEVCEPYGTKTKLYNIKVLEPFPNANTVLIVAGQVRHGAQLQSFSMPPHRQMSFIQHERISFTIMLIMILLGTIYSVIGITKAIKE